jgi:YidC/Oxa1 family membrane protein insertase
MDKNTIIALVAIFGLVIAFQIIFLRPKPQERQAAPQAVEEQAERAETDKSAEARAAEEARAREPIVTPRGPAEQKIVSVDTDLLSVKLSTAGASVVSLKMKAYLDKDQQPVELVSFDPESTTADILPFEVHFDRLRSLKSGDREPYYVEKLSDTSYLFYRDFTDSDGNPLRISKAYEFRDGDYMFDIVVRASALDGGGLNLNRDNIAYTLAWGPVLGPVSVIKNRYNVTTQGYHEAGRYRKVMGGAGGCSLRRAETRYEEISRILDWVGVSNRYFFIGVILDWKDYKENPLYSFDHRSQDKFFFGVSRPRFKDGSFEDVFRVYAGPKDRKILRKYGHGFESVMGGRLLKPITVFLEWMISLFYGLTNSYGLAIILMTVVIKIILHPLTRKSFESMRKMSALQPKIAEIKERFKNNQVEMNKATQALYKKEKINPMGGCLPMLLQLPIFYGLYNALSEMPELRNQSFLWIRDLSLPDTIKTIVANVPFLSYELNGVKYTDINVLPFVMTATTLLQSKLTSGDQTAQQGKMMTYLFPIMFFFIFWNMPSGLVLYWTVQNVLTIGQQYFIDYRFKKKAALAQAVPEKGGKKGVHKGVIKK